MNQVRLDGKVAIVTGGAAGIGLGIVRALAERGAKVVVNGNYRESGAGPEMEVAEEIRRSGGEAIGVNGAVHHPETGEKIARAALDAFGRIDILINNAGTGDATANAADLPCVPDDVMKGQIDVHCYGSMRTAAAVWPHMKSIGGGTILNVGSMASVGLPRLLPEWGFRPGYVFAKAGLYGLTRQMAGAGEKDNIKVNLLLPRAITPLKLRSITGSKLLEWQAEHLPMEPLGYSVVWMVHPDFPATGSFFSSAGGLVARVVFAETQGYFNPDLTPEDVRDNMNLVMGNVDDAGSLQGFYELLDANSEHNHMCKLYEEIDAARERA